MADEKKKDDDEPPNFSKLLGGIGAHSDFIKGLGLGRSAIADGLFTRNMSQINFPTTEERFDFASAASVISELAKRINTWVDNAPENKHLTVTMQTPDGRMMLVEKIKPEGFCAFTAEGFIDNLRCFIVGHITTLQVFCSFEESKGKARVGFIAEVPVMSSTEPLPESEPK